MSERTIELSSEGEESLRKLAAALRTDSHDLALQLLAELVLKRVDLTTASSQPDLALVHKDHVVYLQVKPEDELQPIRSTEGVMGGDACIRNTRIPVWLLIAHKQAGQSDTQILSNYPQLSTADLAAAWNYYATHSSEIESQRRSHEEAA